MKYETNEKGEVTSPELDRVIAELPPSPELGPKWEQIATDPVEGTKHYYTGDCTANIVIHSCECGCKNSVVLVNRKVVGPWHASSTDARRYAEKEVIPLHLPVPAPAPPPVSPCQCYDIGGAVVLLQNGHRVAREGWDEGNYLTLEDDTIWVVDTDRGEESEWHTHSLDILADDYVVIVEA